MKSNRYFMMLALLVLVAPQLVFATALDDYVKKPDASYKYSLVKTIEGKGYTAYVIDMTSQSWRNKKEVDRTLWRHWLTIIKPDKIKSDIGLLWINGGSNNNAAPKSADFIMVRIALGSGTVVADLRMVPNQPLNFPDGGRPRYEDAIIAYTFDKCLTTGDQTWPLLLPMVKSAVRAMDTVQNYLGSDAGGGVKVKKFMVSGASKRGWTTWLTAAVDKRVAAIGPAVIDVLNMKESMEHHFSAYGFYAPAIHDYQEMKVFDRLLTPKGTDHGLDFSAAASLLLFYKSILADSPLPEFTWKVKGNRILVKPISGELKEVNLWQASNEKTRDFRVDTIGRVWKSSPLEPKDNGRYVARVAKPEKGWTAFFVEMIYDSGDAVPHKFTTQVHVVPGWLPFAEKAN
jgi:PhoPQ-activated pathogenicity-related protein